MKPPIDIIDLFPKLNNQLISFLKKLSTDDWQKQTVAKKWVVKDVAAHLLDGNFRRIALYRDGWTEAVGSPIFSNKQLVNYLNTLNADWVKATKRLSPAIIIELLEKTNEEVYQLFKELDPFENAVYAVSWAGETESKNWFDIAREYTERWLHQQQIRDALGNKEIMTKELYYPFLDILMQAWPFICKDVNAEEGTVLKTEITGEGGGEWFLKMQNGKWEIDNIKNTKSVTETIIDGNAAWKIFSKSVRKDDIKGSFEIKDNKQLGEKILDMVSVMA
ncbi:MAG: maleylpyruvate isomerase N-terminal domain-containing protein [Chitinophagaceae bacterium]